MESAGETKPAGVLIHPQEPQRRSPVYDPKAAATPLHPAQTGANSAGGKRRSGRPQTYRQTTARTHRSEPSLPAKRCAPGHANHQRPNAKRQGTHGRSDQTEDAKAEHERTTEATGEAHRRAPGHGPKGGHPGTTEPKTETPDAQAKRPPTHKRPPQTPQQESSPGTGTDHATRTRNPGKPRLTDTPEEEASEADAARPNRHEKHRNCRKDSKTRSKQMVVGGNLLEAQEMRGRKIPINPVLLSQNPDKSREFRSIPSEGTIWTATKNGQCPITSELLPQNPP